jgi:hypothetical protein
LFVQNRNSAGRLVVTGVRADQELVSALLYVLNEKVARAVFIDGHREDAAETLRHIFDRSGYVSMSVNLALEDIPEDTVILLSAAPKTDFLSEEIVKLEQYLSLGGNAMIFYDFSTSSLPRLDAFLSQWGVAVEPKLVFDEVYSYPVQFMHFFPLIGGQVMPGPLPSTEDGVFFTLHNNFPVGVPRARSLRSEWAGGARGNFQLFPLIQTFSGSSYAKNLLDGDGTFERSPGDESGPFVLAYHVRHLTTGADNRQVTSNLIVAGADMVEDTFLMIYGQNFYNIPLISGIINDLNPFGESIFIPSKTLYDSHMPVSAGGTRSVLVLMVVALPLVIILIGVLVWRKRRHQ